MLMLEILEHLEPNPPFDRCGNWGPLSLSLGGSLILKLGTWDFESEKLNSGTDPGMHLLANLGKSPNISRLHMLPM